MYPNWQDDSCVPSELVDRDVGESCDTTSFPAYVANVINAEQVVEAIRFARETKVRTVVKGEGHDLLGRSVCLQKRLLRKLGLMLMLSSFQVDGSFFFFNLDTPYPRHGF